MHKNYMQNSTLKSRKRDKVLISDATHIINDRKQINSITTLKKKKKSKFSMQNLHYNNVITVAISETKQDCSSL